MELTGRTYIFFAAILVLLVGTTNLYEQAKEENAAPGMVVTRAAATAECDQNSVELGDMRLGCQSNTGKDVRVRRLTSSSPSSSALTGGGAKFVSATN